MPLRDHVDHRTASRIFKNLNDKNIQFGPSLNTYSAVLRAHQDLCGDNLCHLENLDRPANLAHKTGDHVKTVKPFPFLPLKGF